MTKRKFVMRPNARGKIISREPGSLCPPPPRKVPANNIVQGVIKGNFKEFYKSLAPVTIASAVG